MQTSLNRETILEALRTKHLGRPLIILETCSSTNDAAARLASDGGVHGLTVIAEEQTAGRGRFGRAWSSPRGGIWMSILLRGSYIANAWDSLALIGALAISRSLISELNVVARVRWPNDVLVDDRKLSGVLVEAKSKGNEPDYALLGMGVNANFPRNIIRDAAPFSTTLQDLLGHPIGREAIICAILSETENLVDLMLSRGPSGILELLEKVECSRGKSVKVKLQDREISGVFDGYDGLARIRLATGSGLLETVETSSVVLAEYTGA